MTTKYQPLPATHTEAIMELSHLSKLPANELTPVVKAYKAILDEALVVLAKRITPLAMSRRLAARFELRGPKGARTASLDDIYQHYMPLLTDKFTG